MNTEPAPTATPHAETLQKLIALGTSIAQDIHDLPATTIPEAEAKARAFDRVARAIRKTILLAQKPAQTPKQTRPDTTQARKQLIRGVEDVIQRNVSAEHAEKLEAELQERLDAPDLDEDLEWALDNRPVDDVIKQICNDLNVGHPGSHPYKRRTPADLRALNARATPPSARPNPGAGRPAPPGHPPPNPSG